MTELWDKYKGKALVFVVGAIIGIPTVGQFAGVEITSKDDGAVCIGVVADEPAETE